MMNNEFDLSKSPLNRVFESAGELKNCALARLVSCDTSPTHFRFSERLGSAVESISRNCAVSVSVNWSRHSVNCSRMATNCNCWIVNSTLSSVSKMSQLINRGYAPCTRLKRLKRLKLSETKHL